MKSNFIAEVKEREVGQPCFLMLILDEDIGLPNKSIVLDLPEGTGIAEAKALRDVLHKSGARIQLL